MGVKLFIKTPDMLQKIVFRKIVSENDKEIPQSQTAYNPMAPQKLILVVLKRLVSMATHDVIPLNGGVPTKNSHISAASQSRLLTLVLN